MVLLGVDMPMLVENGVPKLAEGTLREVELTDWA